ncbi:hypothetical protein EMIT0P260_10672 [Pseudomonas sp. IT-P260]
MLPLAAAGRPLQSVISFADASHPSGSKLPRHKCRRNEAEWELHSIYVYNFLYLTGTICWFFENIPFRDVTAMRHEVAERRN